MDPRTIRALAKTAGDRAKKTQPMSLSDHMNAYRRQNGRKTFTVGQIRRIRKEHGTAGVAIALAGGA